MIYSIRQCVKTFFEKNKKIFKFSYFSGVFVNGFKKIFD